MAMLSPKISSVDIGGNPCYPGLHPPRHNYAERYDEQQPPLLPLQPNTLQVDWQLYSGRYDSSVQRTSQHYTALSCHNSPLPLDESNQALVPFLSPPSPSFDDITYQHYNPLIKCYGVDLFNPASYVFDLSATIGIQQLEHVVMMNQSIPYVFSEQYLNRRPNFSEHSRNLDVPDHQSEKSLKSSEEYSPVSHVQNHQDIIKNELIIQMVCVHCKKYFLSDTELIRHGCTPRHLS
ncbi:hypothetical protein BJV82DRAFT_658166 [Fennellomyces sp. T-0311]|nr:hypothetical protein BJV82DRAFT_658166 [Fennellomyces sp. T-0311]